MLFKIYYILVFIVYTAILPIYADMPIHMQGILAQNISSTSSRLGDPVEIKLTQAVNLPEYRLFIPVNSMLVGQINQIIPASRGLKNAQLTVNFDKLYLPNGYIIYIAGSLESANNNSNNHSRLASLQERFPAPWQQSSSSQPSSSTFQSNLSMKDKMLRAGKIATGTIIGGPIGFASATGSLLFDKGGDISLSAGSTITASITQINNMNNHLEHTTEGIISSPTLYDYAPTYQGKSVR